MTTRGIAVALVLLAGCNDILGISDKELVPEGGTSATGPSGGGGAGTGDAGGGGASGGNGGGGAESCPLDCGGDCIDPSSSNDHCGVCDHACGEDETCTNGVCGRRLHNNCSGAAACVRVEGGLVCWGADEFGQLGIGSPEQGEVPPSLVTVLPDGATPIFAASAVRSTCAVTGDGRVFCYGENRSGSLGTTPADGGPDDGPTAGCCHYVEAVEPEFLPNTTVIDIIAGGFWDRTDYYCARTQERDVYCWGYGSAKPRFKMHDVVALEGGPSIACAVRVDGELWCWIPPPGPIGENSIPLGEPFRVEGLPKIRSVGMSTGGGFAVDVDDEIWVWGPATFGLLGPGTEVSPTYYYPPRPFGHTFESRVIQIAGTYESACALLESGDVYCWGKKGWLGDGSSDEAVWDGTPRKALVSNIREISGSYGAVTARREDGTILQWGDDFLTPTEVVLP